MMLKLVADDVCTTLSSNGPHVIVNVLLPPTCTPDTTKIAKNKTPVQRRITHCGGVRAYLLIA